MTDQTTFMAGEELRTLVLPEPEPVVAPGSILSRGQGTLDLMTVSL